MNTHKTFYSYFITFFFCCSFFVLNAQTNHYETIVYDYYVWKYRSAASEPPTNWMQANFDDSAWSSGMGGFGYGDDDDATFIGPGNGVYLRHDFQVFDLTNLTTLILDADYDDGFVAYLNGVEVARSLVDGTPPSHDAGTAIDHEAVLYAGGTPERFVLTDFENLLEQGNNTLAIQVVNTNPNSSDLTGRFFLSVGVSDDSFTYGLVPDWFEAETEFISSNLPIIVINTTGQEIQDEPRVIAQMGIVANENEERNFLTDPFNDYEGQIEIEIRGNSSQSFEKKNYRIETQTAEGENNNVSLLGMPEENDWVLHGPYSDKSLMRNVLSFHLGNLMGRWAPRTRWCELMINDEYKGVYVLMENIKRDKNRLDIANVKPEDIEGDELTGDYVFRIDWENQDVTDDGWYSSGNWNFFYGFVEPSYQDILPVQRAYLIDHVTDFESAMLSNDYEDTYKDYINVNSMVDYFIINELTKHIDAFKLSFYMQKQKDSKGGKIVFGPIWDFNLGYGNFNFECNPSPIGWIYPCTSVTQWFPRLIEIPEVENRIYCRWRELRTTVFTNDIILRYIDERAEYLEEAQARNFQRYDILDNFVWPNSYIGDTYQNEVDFLKTFLLNRLAWMDGTIADFSIACEMLTSIETPQNASVLVYPNPSTDWIQFDCKTEQVGAILSIYGVDGTVVSKTVLAEAQHRINTQNWTSGNYLYNIKQAGKIIDYGLFVKQ